jgi:hypothetical protein
MTQAYEEVMEMKTPEVEEIESPIVQENKVDELIGELNPRYYEEVISLNEAKDRIHSARVYSNNLFNSYGF